MEQRQQRNATAKKVTISVLVTLLVVGIGAAAYSFNGKLNDLEQQNAALNQAAGADTSERDSSLNVGQPNDDNSSDPADADASQADREIITGQARQEAPGEDVFVECYVFGDAVEEVWLRYGNTLAPQNQTARDRDAIGESEPDLYASAVTSIPGAELEPGGIYTYRCFGTANGETVRGGTASFTTLLDQPQVQQPQQ